VYNSADALQQCLDSVMRSEPDPPAECIVVDDGSTDDSSAIARRSGATVLSTGGRKGPAFARNLGAKAARGEILFFIDADVSVHCDTLERIRSAFDQDPALDGLIGSYDDSPRSQDFLSQYKNLMHCFTHQTARRDACTFWSGCGAIRTPVFIKHSGFEERFTRPAIEDIELGYRLQQAGRKLMLDSAIQVKHLKKWTFFNLLKTDILDRGIPWTELILRDSSMPNDLNIQLSQRVSVALVFLLLFTGAIAAWRWGDVFIVPVFALLLLALGRYWIEGVSPATSAKASIFITLCVLAVAWRASTHGMGALIPLLMVAYFVLFLRHRYAADGTWWRFFSAVLLALMVIGGLAVFIYLPKHPLIAAFLLMTVILIALNNNFYLFLAARRGRLFAVAAIPFHMLYHFYNGLSFATGLLKYSWNRFIVR
jgi:glycosyltransferase involved in cell wall biosynthesis